MRDITRRNLLGSLLAVPIISCSSDDGWVPLFDGRSLEGWTANADSGSFKVQDGLLVANGERSHLFYSGSVRNADFKNFELKAEVMIRDKANSGIFFHTEFQDSGWPSKGFEVQAFNAYVESGAFRENRKTASLYGVRDLYKAMVRDDEWFELHVAVRGKQITIHLNGQLVVDYVEPADPVGSRVLSRGTFALQCHDPGPTVMYRSILVKPLPDDLETTATLPEVDDVYREILRLNADNYPMVDYHGHLKGNLTIEQVLEKSRRDGIFYGLAANCGVGNPVTDDAGAEEYLRSLQGQPVYVAMQAEGREWVTMFSPETVARFDYVFTDSMTWTDDDGKRMRLWLPEEVGEIRDKQRFMETLVDRTVGILNNEPIDIYVNPTFIPDSLNDDYDRLWTDARIEKVIAAAAQNGVAIEINNRYRLPKVDFIRAAKQAGIKFSLGTNNAADELGRCEYGLEMVKECELGWQDFFVPKPDGKKPIQVRGFAKG